MESRVSASLKRSVNETLSPRERERVRTMKSKSATVKRARQFALIIAPLPEHCQCRSQRCSRPDVFTRDGVVKNYGGRGGIRTHGGLPHARFRVECLKPDSATLPAANLSMAKGPALCNVDGPWGK